MRILGLSCHYHDSAAALLCDGELMAAAQEERFSRKKNDSRFPKAAIEFCLAQAKLALEDIDLVAFYERPLLKSHRTLSMLGRGFPHNRRIATDVIPGALRQQYGMRREICQQLGVSVDQVIFVPHHLSHAASTFLCSPFSDAAIVTVDGVGEWATTTIGHGQTDAAGHSQINLCREIHFPHSLGMFYSAFTQYCGFKVNEGEYKLMGMASLGEPRYVDEVRQVIHYDTTDGSFCLDMRYFDFLKSQEHTFSPRFVNLFGVAPRRAEAPIEAAYRDIAASAQYVTEEILLRIVAEAQRQTGSKNVCLAGGVALNSVANGRISRESGLSQLYVQPAAGDAGGALGAALYAHAVIQGEKRKFKMDHAYWGKAYGDDEIATWLRHNGIRSEQVSGEEMLAERVSEMLAKGQVVGWMNGRFEWGPRALGARSIIADPTQPDMRDRINDIIKFREPFRPFAPAVLAERAHELFEFDPNTDGLASRFMLTVHPYREGAGEQMPATNHCGTGRMQAVPVDAGTRWRRLIEAFAERRGVPAILNTSFNRRGEPIVNTPADAMRTFCNSGLDALVLGRSIVTGNNKPDKSLFAGYGQLDYSSETKVAEPVSSAMKDAFYDKYPQMRDYAKLRFAIHPHMGPVQQSDFSTRTVHTDSLGFRHSVDAEGVVHSQSWTTRKCRGLFLGGSAAFGIGATSDETSIASRLSMRSNISFLNLGIRSGTATQELIAALPFMNQAEHIVLVSGSNTLLAYLQGQTAFDPFGPLLKEDGVRRIMRCPFWQLVAAASGGKALDDEMAFPSTDNTLDHNEAVKKAVDLTERNLRQLRAMANAGTQFVFALQPFALIAKDVLDPAEEEAFNLLYKAKKQSYRKNKELIAQHWQEHAVGLCGACNKIGIEFVDLNEVDFSGHCFVDPVHMTDAGQDKVAEKLAEVIR